MIELSAVQNLIASWWFDYDQGNFDVWPQYFTDDAHFSCRSDLGNTEHEAFFRADITGKEAVLDWQRDHRSNSPYPLRHNGTNVHLTCVAANEAEFRSYLFVTDIKNGAVANVSTGLVLGRVREDGGAVKIAELRVILDFANSETFTNIVVSSQEEA